MEDDTPHADETDARAAHDGPERIPVHVPDRFEKHVRDDHASNAALHSVLRTDDDFASVNLMGSHAPGEKDQRPRYHVRITVENPRMGEPSTGATVIDELAKRGDVRILKAYGGARYDDVTVEDETGRGNDPTPDDVVDAVEGTIDGAVDYITVHVRPVEKTVEPITITPNDLPGEYVDIGDVEHTAARTLRKVIDEHGVDSDRAHEAARSLATVVAVHGDPDDDAGGVYDRIWSNAGADPETGETSAVRPVEDGFLFEAPDDERTRSLFGAYLADADVDQIGATSDPVSEDVVFPQTRPPVEPIREWVAENREVFDAPGTLTEAGPKAIADQIADAIERHNTCGTTDEAGAGE